VVAQIKKLLGEEAGAYLSYIELLWANEPQTHAASKQAVFPHQNREHHLYQQTFMNGSCTSQSQKPHLIMAAIWMVQFIADFVLLRTSLISKKKLLRTAHFMQTTPSVFHTSIRRLVWVHLTPFPIALHSPLMHPLLF
jgi:hypothetical protein